MEKDEAKQINKHIHNVRNPLNSISLHAELGNMLINNPEKTDELQKVFTVILQQCRECDRVLSEIRELTLLKE